MSRRLHRLTNHHQGRRMPEQAAAPQPITIPLTDAQRVRLARISTGSFQIENKTGGPVNYAVTFIGNK
jgi:hypothetical protein